MKGQLKLQEIQCKLKKKLLDDAWCLSKMERKFCDSLAKILGVFIELFCASAYTIESKVDRVDRVTCFIFASGLPTPSVDVKRSDLL